MKIKINDIESFRSPESTSFSVDDRVEKIEVINGCVVQDYGYIAEGDVIAVTAVFHKDDVDQIRELWRERTLVTYTDEAGNVYEDRRIVVKGYGYEQKFYDYWRLEFELWNC